MNEQQNVAVTQQIFEAFGRGDIEAMLARFSADAEVSYPGPAVIPYTGTKNGRAEMQSYFEAILDHQSNHNLKVDRFVARGDNVVAIGSYSGVVNATGKTFEGPLAFVFEMHNGLVKRHMLLGDTAATAAAYTAS